jgi:hypothetical protein
VAGCEAALYGRLQLFKGNRVTEPDIPPRVNVYFDGFNFYYGCFKNPQRMDWKPFKWLNLAEFVAKIFPHYHVNRIRYFTALVKSDLHDPDQPVRQQAYLRALRTLPNLTVHEGRFFRSAKKRYEADPSSFIRPYIPIAADPINMVGIIEEEEKGSDVNLASYLLVDGFAGEYDIAIVVSNDSDLAEPIRLVRSILGRQVILLNPRKKTANDLQGIADQYRVIRLGPIQSSQFPDELEDAAGKITKPATW